MKLTKFLAPFVLAVAAIGAAPAQAASDHGPELMRFEGNPGNVASLQRGARDFMSYCSGCHSLKYLRYNRIGQDLGISEELLKTNLMFTSDKLGDQVFSAMPKEAADWFGLTPPDLSLTARARGADWVYSYLNSFYLDPTRPLGVNNDLLPGVSMPHVLGSLQGWQVKVEHHAAAGGEATAEEGHAAKPFELVQKGSMSPEEYKKFTTDLTNFLVYAAEPGRNARISRGWYVFGFLVVFLFLASALKKEYWKDVH